MTIISIINYLRENTGSMKCRILIALLAPLMIIVSCSNSEDLKPKTNAPPVVASANILPERPNIQTELHAMVQSQDPDHDPVTNHYEWVKNGEEIPGENAYILRKGKLQKGDLVQVRVTPSDGKVTGTPFLSAPVKVVNSPPVIQEVRIEPRVAYANDNLKAVVQGFDPDGDSIQYTYQWEKNGVILSEERDETLLTGRFKKGDSITMTATPRDSESLGAPKKSGTTIITNRPPLIVSSPSNKMDGSIYTYQVQANDPDGDPVLFTLKSAPKGMEINKETGLIQWKIHKGDQGTQVIEIEACDGEGAKSIQKYTLSVAAR
jgi:hypothetical protein